MVEDKENLIKQLAEHRQLKTTSLRANNAAAARDMLCTTDNMIKEVRVPRKMHANMVTTTRPAARQPGTLDRLLRVFFHDPRAH